MKVQCRYCQEEINSTATRCPYCTADFSQVEGILDGVNLVPIIHFVGWTAAFFILGVILIEEVLNLSRSGWQYAWAFVISVGIVKEFRHKLPGG